MLYVDYTKSDVPTEFDFNSSKIRSFKAKEAYTQHNRSTVRYHYTSATALLAILDAKNNENGSVRFTDSRYMNDRSEHFFFIKRLFEFMIEHRRIYPYCQEVINNLLLQKHNEKDYLSLKVSELEEIEMNNFVYTKSRHFLFCLSKDSDSLHMWNYYLHNGNYQGYNIGIKIYNFLKNFDYEDNRDLDPVRFYCGNILYKKKEQDKEIETLCKTIEELDKKTEYSLQFAMAQLWSYIECYGLFYKDESFSDENEYRIVLQFEEPLAGVSVAEYFKNSNSDIKYSFFERNGVLVPCLSVPLAKAAVEQITMAPILESHIASESVKEFLESNNYTDVTVKQSDIPIRY